MRIIIILWLTIVFPFLGLGYGVLCAQNVTTGSEKETHAIKEGVTKEAPLVTQIDGHLLINENYLYLNEINQEPLRVYRIIETANPQLYSLLFSLVKEKMQKNKGIRAILLGRAGETAQYIKSDTAYSDGSPVLIESKALTFTSFEVSRIKRVSEVPLADVAEIKMTSLPATLPIEIPKKSIHIKGKIIATHFRSVIPRIEIQGENSNKPTVVIIPFHVKAQKVIEGQMMNLSPKGQLKVGSTIEIWYQEKGIMNIAQMIILPSTE